MGSDESTTLTLLIGSYSVGPVRSKVETLKPYASTAIVRPEHEDKQIPVWREREEDGEKDTIAVAKTSDS